MLHPGEVSLPLLRAAPVRLHGAVGSHAGKANSVSQPGAASKRKLDESESEARAASETPTGDIRSDDEMSELSSLNEPLLELTPKPLAKPPKKRAREVSPSDMPVKSVQPMVNATHLLGASKSQALTGGPSSAT